MPGRWLGLREISGMQRPEWVSIDLSVVWGVLVAYFGCDGGWVVLHLAAYFLNCLLEVLGLAGLLLG